MNCLLAIPGDLESLRQWLWHCWCLCVLLVFRRTPECTRWLSQDMELLCGEDTAVLLHGLLPPAFSVFGKMQLLGCGERRTDCLRKLLKCPVGKYNLLSVHFSAKPSSLAWFVLKWLVPLTLMACIIKLSHYPTPHCGLVCFLSFCKPVKRGVCWMTQIQVRGLHSSWPLGHQRIKNGRIVNVS